jgi:hypothetical protein
MFARPSRFLSVAVVAVLAAACAATTSPAPPSPSLPPGAGPSAGAVPSSDPSAPPAGVLLKVTSEGGFINPVATLAALPIVTVYADGKIMTPAPIPASDPGPLLAGLNVRDVGPDGAKSILAAIRTVGLDKPAAGGPGIPGDAGTDVFTVVIDGVATTSRFSGNGPGGPGVGVGGIVGAGDSGDPERAAAIELLNRLLDPAETWGAPSAPEAAYPPSGYRIFVAPASAQPDPSAGPTPVRWPLAAPLDAFGTPAVPDRGIAGLRQGVALGADADTLTPVFQAATTLTTFTSAGKSYTLYVRPLLPDEAGS